MKESVVYYDILYWYMKNLRWIQIYSKDPVWCFTHPYEYRPEWMHTLRIKMCMIALEMIYDGRY